MCHISNIVVVVVVVEYCCFLMKVIVGPPYLADPVWPLQYTHFSKFDSNVASKRWPGKSARCCYPGVVHFVVSSLRGYS